jgi:predicted ATPase
MALSIKPYLQQISLPASISSDEAYPFSIPAIRTLRSLKFHPDVTFFVGENGSGKSTLLEAIALKLGFGAEGGTKNVQFETANTNSGLHGLLKLTRGFQAPRDSYFLRAESFTTSRLSWIPLAISAATETSLCTSVRMVKRS